MKVLITGGTGQLGFEFTRLFSNLDIEYFATSSAQIDITSINNLREFISGKNIDLIINCSAYNFVDDAESQWKKAYNINGFGVRNLSTIANEIKVPLIHYSTDYVFDGEKKLPYTVFDQTNPLSKYGESKLLGERFASQADRHFIIRVSWVFGIGNKNFVKNLINMSKEKKEISMVDEQFSSPSYTVDIARTTYDLFRSGVFGLYHITNSGYCSRYEWAEYILNKTGWTGTLKKAKLSDFDSPAKRPVFTALDNFGTPEITGYNSPSWQNAIDRFLADDLKI